MDYSFYITLFVSFWEQNFDEAAGANILSTGEPSLALGYL